MSPTWLGVSAGLSASVFWGLANLQVQKAGRAAGTLVALFWTQVVGGLCLSAGLAIWPPPGTPVRWGWLALGATATAVGYVGMFRAFAGGPLSIVSPLVSGWAIVAAGLGVVAHGESLPAVRAVGAALVIGGGAILLARSGTGAGTWRGRRPIVLLWALAAALGFGTMVATLRPLGQDLGPILAMLALWGGQWLLLLPLALTRPAFRRRPPRSAWPAIALAGALEAGGFLSVQLGALSAPLTIVAPASGLASLTTVVLARLVLGEPLGPDRLGLAAVITVGIVLLGLG